MWDVMRRRVGDPARKLVLLILADGASDDGFGRSCFSRAAEMSETDKEGFKKLLDTMQDEGILRWNFHPENTSDFIFKINYAHQIFEGERS